MTREADDNEFPSLFLHSNRADWGVSVLSGERDGKRRYLFEGGEERTMGAGALDMMRKVAHPDREQQAAYVRLTALLARRGGRAEPSPAPGTAALIKQLAKLHAKYQGGFFGPAWKSEAKSTYARQVRGAIADKAQADLSKKALEKLSKLQRFDSVWQLVVALAAESGMAGEQLRLVSAVDQQRLLGGAVIELLHGAGPYETRFDRFVAAYAAAFRDPPGWETATFLTAILHPTEHVYVEPGSFRKQLKAMSRVSTLAARPNGANYQRCLGMAQALANMLAARGDVPRDLLDVHDFVRETVGASAKQAAASAQA